MDKPPKKDDKSKSEENAKAASVLDNILGGDLGFGADDLSLDLGLDLDTIIDKGLTDSSKSSGFDDLFSSMPTKVEAKKPSQEESPDTSPPTTTEAQSASVDVPDTIREVTTAETPETTEASEAPVLAEAVPEAAPETPQAPVEAAAEPQESVEASDAADVPEASSEPIAAAENSEEASSAEASADEAIETTAAPTEDAASQADAPSEAEPVAAAPEEMEGSDDADDVEISPPAIADAPVQDAPAADSPSEEPRQVAPKADISGDPAAIAAPGTVPTTIEITADEIVEDGEDQANDPPKPPDRVELAATGQNAHERTMELEEADEVLEELRKIHQRTIGGAATPPPPPQKKGPPPPPPSHRRAAATPPPPPVGAFTPPPPSQSTEAEEPLLRDPSSDAPGTLELDVVDAVLAPSDPDDTQRIKAKALEEAPIQIELPADAPAAALPSPPEDLKELLDVPTPNMPSPPNELQHDIDIPKAQLPPPPDPLQHDVDIPKAHLPPPPADLKAATGGTETTSADDGSNGAAAPQSLGALFPDVDPSEPPVAFSVPKETAPQKAPATSDEEALADAFNDSMSELAAIASQPSLPAAEAPAPVEATAKSTQLLGPDFTSSLQQELHQMEPGQEDAAPASSGDEISIEFPPKEAAPPTSGTADFLDADAPIAPASQAPQAAKKKPANPLMQTAMYGSEAVEMQQQLIEAQKAAEAAKAGTPDKKAGEGFQTQMYTADDVSKAGISIGMAQADNRSTLESTPAVEADEEDRPGLKVQLDSSAQSFKSELPADSLFDVNMDSEIEARVAAKKREAEAERAIQNNNFAAAIRIYHELQQQFPQEAHFQDKLKQLVALEKKSKGTPAMAPSQPGPARPGPAVGAPPNNAQAQPAARPAMTSARKQPPKKGLSTLNMVLAALVIILTLTLFTGLVWPGWLRGKSKPATPEKPKTVAPLVR